MPNDYRGRFYDEYVASHYEPQGLIDPTTYLKAVSFFERNYGSVLPITKSAPVLEVGCGAGQFIYFLKKKGYSNLVGVDSSAPMIELGRKATQIETLWQGDVESYFAAHADQQFNCIIANDLAEHLTKPELIAFLDHCYTRLFPGPGNHIILRIPNAASWFGARERFVDFTHELAFTPESISQVLRVVGFAGIQVRPVIGSYLGGRKAKVRSVLNQLFIQPFTKLVFATMYGFGRSPLVLTPSMIAVGHRPQ